MRRKRSAALLLHQRRDVVEVLLGHPAEEIGSAPPNGEPAPLGENL